MVHRSEVVCWVVLEQDGDAHLSTCTHTLPNPLKDNSEEK